MAQTETRARRKPRFRERSAVKPAEAPAQRPPAAAPPPPVAPRTRLQPGPQARILPQVSVEQALYGLLLGVGFLLRIWDVGSRAMHGDEAVHAWLAWNLFHGAGYQYDPVYHGPLQFLVTTVFFFLFGVSNTTGRLMAVLFGTALIGMPYFLRREMGRTAALVAAAFITISPAFVYVSRFERDDIFTSFFAITMAVALFGYLRTRRIRYVYLGAAAIALSLAAMENTYITLFVFGSFLLIVWGAELLASRRPEIARRLASSMGSRAVPAPALLVGGVLLAVAFIITVTWGLALPVPLVLALGLVGLVARQAVLEMEGSRSTPFLAALSSISRRQWLNAVTIIAAILFLAYSVFGSDLRGIWDASKPLLNNGACPRNPFPLNPCRKDLIGGLFYWLSQHEVHRGGQPWFYYSFLFGLYEQIAVVFGIGGMIWFLRRPTIFTTFLTFWAIVMFGVYSWAGEKFAWLTIHPLLPFLLLGAMFTVDLMRQASRIRYPAALVLGVLVLLELHSTYEVNFVNGANPVEMMVYVQSSPDTPKVANDILTLSNKVTNGKDLHVTIDSLDTWPFGWYLRDMPNVAYPAYPQLLQKPYSTNPVIIVDPSHRAALAPQLRHYTGHLYRLRWWFPENYKTLSWATFGREAINPGYWRVVWDWLINRRPFGPKGAMLFYYYVKNGLASPY